MGGATFNHDCLCDARAAGVSEGYNRFGRAARRVPPWSAVKLFQRFHRRLRTGQDTESVTYCVVLPDLTSLVDSSRGKVTYGYRSAPVHILVVGEPGGDHIDT